MRIVFKVFTAITICLTTTFTMPAFAGKSCGLSGTVEERVLDCGVRETVNESDWALVTRTVAEEEVWRDEATRILWSDRLNYTQLQDPYFAGKMTHYEATTACEDVRSLGARGNLSMVNWALPSVEDFRLAENHGIRNILPNMENRYFWASTVRDRYHEVGWIFSGYSGDSFGESCFYDNSVRCISR